jgi:hypothetical protein
MTEGKSAEAGEQVEIVAPLGVIDDGAFGPPLHCLDSHESEQRGEAGVHMVVVMAYDLSKVNQLGI